MKKALGPITPAKAAAGAALLGAFAALAVLAWPSGGGQAPVVAEPSATATAKPAPKAPTASPSTIPTPRPELPPSRSLTFQPDQSGRYFRGIYERRPNGLIALLVENPALVSDAQFSVSQDGRRLAFEYKDTLYRYERGGAEGPVPVVSFPILNKVLLSADGGRALVTGYLHGVEGGEATYMVDMVSGSVTGFLPEGHKPFRPAWSPDGSWISFIEQGTCEKQATYVVASDGTGLRKVADVSGDQAWSPDGRRLALSGPCGGGVSLVDLDAGPIGLSATIPSPSRPGPWSPDGRLLTFVAQGEIHVIDTETGRQWTVAKGVEPTWSPDGSALAFSRDGNIYISNLDGSSQSQVTFPTQPYSESPSWLPDGSLMFAFAPPLESAVYVRELATGTETDLAEGRAPLWSPDGTRIAFVAGRGSSEELYVMGADGEGPAKVGAQNFDDIIGPCEEGQTVAWSPDSQTIAYSDSVEARISAVYVKPGVAPTVLASGYTPAWSPIGDRLAYSSFDESGCIIRLLNVDSPRDDKFLTVGPKSLWSPDGRKMAFARTRSDHYSHDVFVIAADGTGERQLTFPRGEGLKYGYTIGSWSPDSTQLALARFPLAESGDVASGWQSGEIVIVDTETGQFRQLVNGYNPVWSPDGDQIAFIRWDVNDVFRSLTPYIYLVDADGKSEPVLLAQGEHPSWSPDGTRIAFTRDLDR